MARVDHIILNIIIVGSVFTVDVHINARLDTNAKIYSHHHCIPKRRPGIIIVALVINDINSIKLTLFQ
jgi:hypothetical protein